MKADRWVRPAHRWLSLAFTVLVLVNILLTGAGKAAECRYLLPLAPLLLLMGTGIYLFILPYRARARESGV